MKTTDDKIGQTLALTNVARTLEYKGDIDEACDCWQEVCMYSIHMYICICTWLVLMLVFIL